MCGNWSRGITGQKPAQVLNLVTSETPPSIPDIPSHKTDTSFTNSLESPYGTMHPDSLFYIERKADNSCWNYLGQIKADTIFVQAPTQMGKSSLMRRIIHRAKREYKVDVVFVDFEKFTEKQLDHEEEFLIELCYMIGDALGIPEAISHYWNSRRSSLVKCSNYISHHIIGTIGKHFILAMG